MGKINKITGKINMANNNLTLYVYETRRKDEKTGIRELVAHKDEKFGVGRKWATTNSQ